MTSKKSFIIFVLFPLILFTIIMWFMAPPVKSAERYIPAKLTEVADSMKLFLYAADAATILDSSAGAARTDVQAYDTVVTVNTADSSYWVIYKIWFPNEDSVAYWSWWIESQGTATISITDKQEIATYVKDTAEIYPEIFFGPSATGFGSDTVRVFAIDTSGTDNAVEDVKITVNNAAGNTVASQNTIGDGSATFTLDPATYTLLGRKTGYVFPTASLVVAGDDDSTAFNGYDLGSTISLPSSPDQSTVYGYVYDNAGNTIQYATVIFTLSEKLKDTCNSTIIIPIEHVTVTDENGLFQQELLKTDCFKGNSAKWRVNVYYTDGNNADKTHSFNIPTDSTTYFLVF